MDEITFIPAQQDIGLGQYRIVIIRYNAVLTWERYPYRQNFDDVIDGLAQRGRARVV